MGTFNQLGSERPSIAPRALNHWLLPRLTRLVRRLRDLRMGDVLVRVVWNIEPAAAGTRREEHDEIATEFTLRLAR